LACSGLLLSTWLIVGDDDAVSSGLSGSSPCLWRCSVLLCALLVCVVCVVVFASARYVKLLFFLYDMEVLLPFIKKPRWGVGGLE
jgi:hypothetical protein